MGKHNQTGGLRRIWNAGLYSIAGIRASWRNEAAFRQELLLCVILLPAALVVGHTAVQRALLIASCLLVLIVELLNSAIEAVVDRISSELHTLSGRAKDMGSAAVFISLLLTLICWALVIHDNYF